jgi:hypothetical protein
MVTGPFNAADMALLPSLMVITNESIFQFQHFCEADHGCHPRFDHIEYASATFSAGSNGPFAI